MLVIGPRVEIQALQKQLDKVQFAASQKGSLDIFEKELYDAQVAKIHAAIKEVSDTAIRSPAEANLDVSPTSSSPGATQKSQYRVRLILNLKL